jgi:hypothetical protein
MAWTIFSNRTLHRLGHPVISLALGLALYWRGLELLEAFVLACVVVPITLELVDTYLGGLLVFRWSERAAIWERARARGFTLSADSARDLWEYQLGWLGFWALVIWNAIA